MILWGCMGNMVNRNKIVHEFYSQVPDHIWGFARNYILEFKRALIACSQTLSRLEGKWIAPPPGMFKINVDGATSEIDRNSSVGVVIRDAAGNVHTACCKYLQGQYSVEEVEVRLWSVVSFLPKSISFPKLSWNLML